MVKLTEKQKELLLRIINNAQGRGVQFLFSYEAKLNEHSEEVTLWYKETKEEFMELEKLKKVLISIK